MWETILYMRDHTLSMWDGILHVDYDLQKLLRQF